MQQTTRTGEAMKQETIDRIRRFSQERDWDQFHTPANLAKSISMEHDERTGSTAEKAVAYVAGKALQPNVPVLCALGGKYKLFVFLTRLLPTKVLTDLVGEIYAKQVRNP